MTVQNGEIVRKSDLVRQLVAQNKFKEALRIAKGFRLGISKEDSETMSRGYECIVHPMFYQQLGYDTEETVRLGVQVLQKLYG